MFCRVCRPLCATLPRRTYLDSILTDEHLSHHEAALDAFGAGQWLQALEFLHRVPTEDTAKDFLEGFILRHRRVAPNWQRIIPLDRKT